MWNELSLCIVALTFSMNEVKCSHIVATLLLPSLLLPFFHILFVCECIEPLKSRNNETDLKFS